ncbi:MAG: membrane protein insertase YidC, partial [Bacteroidota bacterium]
MDRNAILAVVLASIVLIVWTVFFAPPPPEFEAIPVDSTATAQQLPELDEPDAVAERPAAGVEEVPTQSFNDSTFALAQIGTAEAVTVETDLYQAVFSTKGGTLTSFILKEYDTFGHERPVQIVDTTGAGALSLVFTSLDSRLVDTRALYFEPSARGPVLADDAERELTFTRALGSGALRYTYTFTPGSYEVGMRVEADGAASFMATDGYEFIWNGGVPFAEGGAKEEAMVSGAYVRSGGEVESVNLTSDPVESYRLGGSIEWIAVKNSFFTAVVLPSSDVGTRGAELEGERIGEDTDPNFWETYEARILVNRPAGDADTYRMYLGPVDYKQFSEYGVNLYDIVDYGFGSFVTRPIAKWIVMPSFNFLSSFIPNYGFVIIIFAILIKLILFPLTKSSYRSMAKMRTLQPKMAEIKEKYKNDPQKQQQATMKMYQESGVNPLGSCLPQLLQLPILFALFRFFPTSIDIRQEGFLWAQDLSAPDVVLNLPFS